MMLILLDWERPELPELLPVAYNTLTILENHKPEKKMVLEKMGIFERLFKILKHRKEAFPCPPKTETITAAHLIALFLPALSESNCYECVESLFENSFNRWPF